MNMFHSVFKLHAFSYALPPVSVLVAVDSCLEVSLLCLRTFIAIIADPKTWAFCSLVMWWPLPARWVTSPHWAHLPCKFRRDCGCYSSVPWWVFEALYKESTANTNLHLSCSCFFVQVMKI